MNNSLPALFPDHSTALHRRRRQGILPSPPAFTLVEVSVAIGIVTFSLLAILAVLPVGLQTFKDSKTETALVSIQRHVRAEAVQQWTSIAGTTFYFSADGIPLANATDAHFRATATLAR